MTDTTIGERLARVRERVARAARSCGRDPSEITLLAVSKTKPSSDVVAAYEAGQRDFGENYAQELVTKTTELAHLVDVRWHFIGRLQSNKAKLVAPRAGMVHAVDSSSLANELAKRAGPREPLPVLVEVNVGDEASKGGVQPDDLAALLSEIQRLPTLLLRGLMAIPPHTERPEDARRFHRALRELRDVHGGPTRLPTLSMGMTDDLEVAIEEGATVVRVGTAIFGARQTP